MSFLGYGAGKAMAYKHDFQKDIDRLYKREAYAAEIRAETEKKTTYWAEQMKRTKPVNPSITADLEKHYDGLTSQMADLAAANPGWERDVTIMQQMNSLSDGFLNNDLLREDMQGQAEFEKLKQAVANGDITQLKFKQEMETYNAWQNDYQAVNDEGNRVGPYVYSNPMQVTISDVLKLGNEELEAKRNVSVGDDGTIKDITKVPDNAYHIKAEQLYTQSEEFQMAVDSAYKDLAGTKFENMFATPEKYLAHMLKHGEREAIDMSKKSQEYMADYDANLDGKSQGGSLFQSNVMSTYLKNGRVQVGEEALLFTEFGGKGKYISTPAQGKSFYVQTNDDEKYKEIRIHGTIVSRGATEIEGIAGPGDTDGSRAFVHSSVAVFANDYDNSIMTDTDGKIYRNGGEVEIGQLTPEEKSRLEFVEDKWKLKQNADYIKEMEKYGFKMDKVTIPLENPVADIKETMNKTSMTITVDAYVGGVLMPGSFNGLNQYKYDKTLQGTADVGDNFARGLYDEGYNMGTLWNQAALRKTDQGYGQASSHAEDLAKNRLSAIVKDDVYVEHGVKPEQMEWQAHEDYPNIWFSLFKNKENKKVAVWVDPSSGETMEVAPESLDSIYNLFK